MRCFADSFKYEVHNRSVASVLAIKTPWELTSNKTAEEDKQRWDLGVEGVRKWVEGRRGEERRGERGCFGVVSVLNPLLGYDR